MMVFWLYNGHSKDGLLNQSQLSFFMLLITYVKTLLLHQVSYIYLTLFPLNSYHFLYCCYFAFLEPSMYHKQPFYLYPVRVRSAYIPNSLHWVFFCCCCVRRLIIFFLFDSYIKLFFLFLFLLVQWESYLQVQWMKKNWKILRSLKKQRTKRYFGDTKFFVPMYVFFLRLWWFLITSYYKF